MIKSYLEYFREKWQHTGFQKYLKNTGWIFAARVITFLTSFFTVAIVTRYLGPENLGMLDYAQSFVAIISVFASLGIDQILYRDLINNPEQENVLIGTAVLSKLIFGLVAFIVSILLSVLLGNSLIVTLLISIISLTFIINPVGTVGVFFKAQVEAKYGSQISIFLAFFLPVIKLLIIYFNQGIIYFAAVLLIESLIFTTWSLYIYVKSFNGNFLKWSFSLDVFKKLMMDSWPLLLAGFSGYIYAKMDQIMLLHYLNFTAIGLYSSAVRLTQVWAFIPGMIIGSLFPAIINAKKINQSQYFKRFNILSKITIGISILIAFPLFIFAPYIIKIVFGNEFITATPILRIYLWISIITTITVIAQHYLIIENLNKIYLFSNIIGAIANIVLNIILIPIYGPQGAALGTAFSYAIVVISLLFFKVTRKGLFKIFMFEKYHEKGNNVRNI